MKKTILIVDDQRVQRLILRSLLEANGYIVIEAANAKDAIGIFEANPVDVMITDLIMPEMSGIELCESLKKNRPDATIFAISGGIGNIKGGADEYLKLASISGASKTFSKPVDPQEILQALKEV